MKLSEDAENPESANMLPKSVCFSNWMCVESLTCFS